MFPRPAYGCATCFAIVSVVASAAHGQVRQVTRSPAELLSAYEHDTQVTGSHSSAGAELVYVVTGSADYPPAERAAVLDGLERFAVSGGSIRLKGEAAITLGLAGATTSVAPVPGVEARLERIYRASPEARSAVIDAMAMLIDRQAALAFVEQIATQGPWHEDFPGAAKAALSSLVAMGDQGRAALKRLHDTGGVQDPEARAALAALARRGYRLPNPAREPTR